MAESRAGRSPSPMSPSRALSPSRSPSRLSPGLLPLKRSDTGRPHVDVDIDLNPSELSLSSPAMYTAHSSQLASVDLLHREGPEIDSAAELASKSPLVQAIWRGEALQVLSLIRSVPVDERLSFVNEVDKDGFTPIFYALGKSPQAFDILTLLLDFGADPTAVDINRRNSPLHVACQSMNKKAILQLVRYYEMCVAKGKRAADDDKSLPPVPGADKAAAPAASAKPKRKGASNDYTKLENCEHQLCYKLVPGGNDAEQACNAFLNACCEQAMEEVDTGKVLRMSREKRCYWRSVFDTCDTEERGGISLTQVSSLMSSLEESVDASGKKRYFIRREPAASFLRFFEAWDKDRNAVLFFPEFVYGVVKYSDWLEAARTKGDRAAKKAKHKGSAGQMSTKVNAASATQRTGSISLPDAVSHYSARAAASSRRSPGASIHFSDDAASPAARTSFPAIGRATADRE